MVKGLQQTIILVWGRSVQCMLLYSSLQTFLFSRKLCRAAKKTVFFIRLRYFSFGQAWFQNQERQSEWLFIFPLLSFLRNWDSPSDDIDWPKRRVPLAISPLQGLQLFIFLYPRGSNSADPQQGWLERSFGLFPVCFSFFVKQNNNLFSCDRGGMGKLIKVSKMSEKVHSFLGGGVHSLIGSS